MLINHEIKYIYIDTPKTGSTSVENVLFKHGFEIVYRQDKNERHNRIISPKYKNYTKIATVRNPYTRTLSQWTFNKILKNRLDEFENIEQFTDWLIDIDNMYNTNEIDHDICGWFSCSKYLEKTGYDIILHQENLEEDINELEFITTPVKLDRINDSNSKEYTKLLNKNVKEKINQYCKNDFAEFDYIEEKI